ncbi:valacyclovir hydrolase isoform X2 [Mirounga angustirostris]|uniref:valacyclovir hydrolase isoform X2 n=1 Tax=Mirounga angustirostris TaxID=9716 RepID=UPI00313AB454
MRDSIPGLQDHDLSRRQSLNRLSHPGAPWSPPSCPYTATRSLRDVGAREAVGLPSTSAAPGLSASAVHRLQFGDSGALKDLVMELKPFIVQTKETQGGSGETDFGPQIKNLNKKLFTVVAWDPRGYGHSRPPDRDFPVDFFERDAKDAVDLMKTLKFKKVSLLGWSDGGITSLIAAAKYPSFINKMVIWGANAYVTDEDEKIYQGIRDVSKWSEKTRKPLETLYGYDYFAKTCEKWVDGIKQFKRLPDGNICGHLLPLIQCPTLIVHGEKDPLVPRFHADFIHKHVRGSRQRERGRQREKQALRRADAGLDPRTPWILT